MTNKEMTAQQRAKDLQKQLRKELAESRRLTKQLNDMLDKAEKAAKNKHSKSFGGSLSDEELKKMLGISYGSLYKYKRELKTPL